MLFTFNQLPNVIRYPNWGEKKEGKPIYKCEIFNGKFDSKFEKLPEGFELWIEI